MYAYTKVSESLVKDYRTILHMMIEVRQDVVVEDTLRVVDLVMI